MSEQFIIARLWNKPLSVRAFAMEEGESPAIAYCYRYAKHGGIVVVEEDELWAVRCLDPRGAYEASRITIAEVQEALKRSEEKGETHTYGKAN